MIAASGSSFVLCIENEGYEISLERRKVYRRLEDDCIPDDSIVRVIDESGESYLFPAAYFVPVVIPEAATSMFDEASA